MSEWYRCLGYVELTSIRGACKHTLIPLVNSHVYLGAKLSFFAFEDLTLAHRLHVSKVTFLRLRPWLLQRHTYPMHLRVKLWETCVKSSCLHSLQAVGITQKGALRLHQRFLGDLRQIARSPSHVTHETSIALCNRLGLDLPLSGLAALYTRQHAQRCLKWEGLPTHDFLRSFDIHIHHALVMQAFDQSMPKAELSEVHLCPYCDFSTQFQSQLTKHMQKVHLTALIRPTFQPLRDMFLGRPHCAHCGKTFTGFAGLRKHITLGSCPQFNEHSPWQDPLADDERLRAMAASGHWNGLWADEALLSQLRQCCVICNHQAPTTKSLAEHLHREHPSAWEAAQVHLAPLIAQNVGHPCRACGQRGSRSHACPVLRQLALISALQVKGVSATILMTPNLQPTTEVPLSSPTKRHKAQDDRPTKKPIIHEFHPARDSLDGLPQCAHCGRPLHHHHALQKHIEEGHCPSFDNSRAIGNHVPCAWPWLTDLASPDIPKALLFHEDALQVIKTTCVLCGQKLGHSRHVIAHLQHDHGPFLTQAQDSLPDMLAALRAIKPCSCDCIRPSLDHQCSVHHQILVLHHLCATDRHPRLGQFLDPTWPYTEIWQDAALRAKLTEQCAHCGLNCGNHQLKDHLLSHEGLFTGMASHLHLAQSPFMDCCAACMAADAPPDVCPVALNICSYVHSRAVGPAGRGLHGSDRGLSGPPDDGSFRTKQAKERPGTTASPPSSTEPTTLKSHRPTPSSTRKSTASTSYGRPIHTFFASRPSRTTSPLGAGNLPLEGDDREEGHHYSFETTPLPDGNSRNGDTSGQTGSSSTNRSTLAESLGPAADHQRGAMAIPSVRCSEEGHDSYGQKTDCNGPDAADDSGDERTGPRPEPDLAVQVPEETWTQSGQTGDSLASPTVNAPSTVVGHPVDPCSLRSLEPYYEQIEAAPNPGQPIGRNIGQKFARRIPRPEAGRACLSASLANDGVICYVNANLLAVTWSALQVKGADWQDFGVSEAGIQKLLMAEASPKHALAPEEFAALRDRWGSFGQQADPHEFLTTFLEWSCMPNVDVSWQRRLLVLEQVQVSDQGSRGVPPTLVAADPKQSPQTLQALIHEWHSYSGMHTCFNCESELLCMHIDRYANHSGAVERTTWALDLPDEVQLPFWCADGSMTIVWRPYTVVATVLHSGLDRAGHLQAALKTEQGYFITDDGGIARAPDPSLQTRLRDIILVWFVATTVYSPSGIAAPQWGKDDLVHRLAVMMHEGKAKEIRHNAKLLKLLRTSCGACGCLLFSPDSMDDHFKNHHPGLWLAPIAPWKQP